MKQPRLQLVGVSFSRAFAGVASTSRAFGANLLGVVEYVSMILGLRALSLIAGALYVAAGLAAERRPASAAPTASPQG